jgi:hypothetical protein
VTTHVTISIPPTKIFDSSPLGSRLAGLATETSISSGFVRRPLRTTTTNTPLTFSSSTSSSHKNQAVKYSCKFALIDSEAWSLRHQLQPESTANHHSSLSSTTTPGIQPCSSVTSRYYCCCIRSRRTTTTSLLSTFHTLPPLHSLRRRLVL